MGLHLIKEQKKNLLVEQSYSKRMIYAIILLNGLLLTFSTFFYPDPKVIFDPLILKLITILFYFSIPVIMALKENINEKFNFHSLMATSLAILSLTKLETLHLPIVFLLLILSFVFQEQKKGLFYCFLAIVTFTLKQNMPLKDFFMTFLFFIPLFFLYYLSLKKLNKINDLLFFHERSFLSFLENFEIPNIINYCILQTGDQKLFWGEKGQNIKVHILQGKNIMQKLRRLVFLCTLF